MQLRGDIAEYSLPELFAHLAVAEASGTLRVWGHGSCASVVFRRGRVHHASLAEERPTKRSSSDATRSQQAEHRVTGLRALAVIFKWREGTFELSSRVGSRSLKASVGIEVPELFRRLVSRQPDLAAAIWPLPPPDVELRPVSLENGRSTKRLTTGELALLSELAEGRTLTDLTGRSLSDALENVRNLRGLLAEGVVSYAGRDVRGMRLLKACLKAFIRESKAQWITTATLDGLILVEDGDPPGCPSSEITALAAGAARVCGRMSALINQPDEVRLVIDSGGSSVLVQQEGGGLIVVLFSSKVPLGVVRVYLKDLLQLCGGCLEQLVRDAWLVRRQPVSAAEPLSVELDAAG